MKQRYNVLVAEDTPDIRSMVVRSLQLIYGKKVVAYEASTGELALEVIRANPKPTGSKVGEGIDLLITDITMPDKTGLEVIAALPELSPGTKVIAMSARASEYQGKLGPDIKILEKPFGSGAFKETVAGYIPLPKKQMQQKPA